jgi:hypothetical protein
MQFEFLSAVVALLDDAEIPHMLAGSMASTFHGEPRMTRNIDMVIDPTLESIGRFVAALDRARYYVDDAVEAVRRRDMCNVIDTETGWKVDLIVRKDRRPMDDSAITSPHRHHIFTAIDFRCRTASRAVVLGGLPESREKRGHLLTRD